MCKGKDILEKTKQGKRGALNVGGFPNLLVTYIVISWLGLW